jgi:hypothetical protein
MDIHACALRLVVDYYIRTKFFDQGLKGDVLSRSDSIVELVVVVDLAIYVRMEQKCSDADSLEIIKSAYLLRSSMKCPTLIESSEKM